MTKLYQQIPIETWKRIAYKVQRLKISDCSDEEFQANLKLLQKLLLDDDKINISLQEGKREPKTFEEIGLASLLHSIYGGRRWVYRNIKSDFYEYIYALNDLGLNAMKYRPIGFDRLADDILKISIGDPKRHNRKKLYTNGTFELKYFHGYFGKVVKLDKLKNATFLIHLTLDSIKNNRACSHVISKDFKLSDNKFPCDSIFPTKEELDSVEFPKLMTEKQIVQFGENPEYSQVYDRLNLEKLSCSKRLTKTPNGVYYYKEYHNK